MTDKNEPMSSRIESFLLDYLSEQGGEAFLMDAQWAVFSDLGLDTYAEARNAFGGVVDSLCQRGIMVRGLDGGVNDLTLTARRVDALSAVARSCLDGEQ